MPRARGIGHDDLVKVFNDRGAVICAADVSPLVAPRRRSSRSSRAPSIEPIEVDGERVDDRRLHEHADARRGRRCQGTSSMAPNSCLVQVETWRGVGARRCASGSEVRDEASGT